MRKLLEKLFQRKLLDKRGKIPLYRIMNTHYKKSISFEQRDSVQLEAIAISFCFEESFYTVYFEFIEESFMKDRKAK